MKFTKSQKVLHAVRNTKTGCSLHYHKGTNTTTGYWYGKRNAAGWRPYYTFKVNGKTVERNYGEEHLGDGIFEERPEKPKEPGNSRKLTTEEIVALIFDGFDPKTSLSKPVKTKLEPYIEQHLNSKRLAHTLYKGGICPCGHKIPKKLRENQPCPKCECPL